MASLDEAVNQMRAAGMPDFPAGHPLLNTSKIVRYGPKKKGWYRLFEHVSDKNGRSHVTGAFGLHGCLDTTRISTSFSGLDQDERERMHLTFRQAAAREEKKREARAAAAEAQAGLQWAAANTDGPWPYLNRKGVDPEGVRSLPDGTLLVPMFKYTADRDSNPILRGLQKIAPDGSKRFTKGMTKDGAMLLLGTVSGVSAKAIMVCEGYATARSIRIATKHMVAVAVTFDAGNLLPAAAALRARYSDAHLVFAADDDWKTEVPKGTPLNTGILKAQACVETFDASSLVVPVFAAHGRHHSWTDFNDLHACAGLEVVVKQLEAPLARVCTLPAPLPAKTGQAANTAEHVPVTALKELVPLRAQQNPERHSEIFLPSLPNNLGAGPAQVLAVKPQALDEHSLADRAPPLRTGEGPVPGNGAPPKNADGDWGAGFQRMLERYTLLYGTTSLWDSEQREIIGSDAISLAWPAYWRQWKNSPYRKMISYSRVVFDPTGAKTEPNYINLFDGFALEPKAGTCSAIRNLLAHLCGENPEMLTWVTRWLAIPLKCPGTKLNTAVIMHGDEGSGKNLFASVMQEIYGKYATIIVQDQIEGRYNDWASKKLFVVANEVLTRADMRSHKGRLKGMVSEAKIQIEGKFQPLREEANSMNVVFFSNEVQPLMLDPSDRRYCVIWTPPPLPKEAYEAVATELKNGGAAAFYAYLLEFPLGEQTAMSRPPLNEAKRDLIALGKSSATNFYEEWRAGLTPFPFITCSTVDAFKAYGVYCQRHGERNPWTSTKFIREMKRALHSATKYFVVPDSEKVEQAHVFIVPVPINDGPSAPSSEAEPVAERYRTGRSVGSFRRALQATDNGSWTVLAPLDTLPTGDEAPCPF